MAKKSDKEPPVKPASKLLPRRLRSSPTDPPDRLPAVLKQPPKTPPRVPPSSAQQESLATTEHLP